MNERMFHVFCYENREKFKTSSFITSYAFILLLLRLLHSSHFCTWWLYNFIMLQVKLLHISTILLCLFHFFIFFSSFYLSRFGSVKYYYVNWFFLVMCSLYFHFRNFLHLLWRCDIISSILHIWIVWKGFWGGKFYSSFFFVKTV